MWNAMTTMQIELPMFIAASQLNITYAQNTTSGMNCMSFYETILGFTTQVSTSLCADSSNTFNWQYDSNNYQAYFKTAVALTSVYMYGSAFNTANAGYFELFT
jgi:hypothetical protein